MTPLLLPVLIRLLVPAGQAPTELDLIAMTSETRRIWAPGATVQLAEAAGPVPAGDTAVWVRFADQLGPTAHANALAWTPFTDGRPGGVITVSPGRIRAAVARGTGRAPDAPP